MKDNEKVLGVIGGMGPLATQLFYKMVIENTQAHKDQDHINMVILNHASMPDRTQAILNGNLPDLLQRLETDAGILEYAGADYLVIPCNTCHVLVPELQKKTTVKVINMIETTVDHVRAIYGESAKVGIMATDGTVKMGLYQKACRERNLEPVVPSADCQKLVMKIIYEGIKDEGDIDYDEFKQVENELREAGCDCVIMACTELSCFKEMYNLSDYFVDAMGIMAETAIVLCDREVRKERHD